MIKDGKTSTAEKEQDSPSSNADQTSCHPARWNDFALGVARDLAVVVLAQVSVSFFSNGLAFFSRVCVPTTHVMCNKCGRINSKNKAGKHKKSHNADGARAKRDRGREDLDTFTPEAPRMFWSELLMPGRCIDDMWSGRAEDLRDPTEMFELIYELFCRQIRVPQPFAHFGVLPIWRIWNDTKGYPELLYEPSKEDRDRLWLRHMAQAVKESNSTSFGAPYATRV